MTDRSVDAPVEVWHNPRCSKSRAALAQLDQAGVAYTVRRYLDDPPTVDELRQVLQRLGVQPWDIARTSEAVARELGMNLWGRTPDDWDRWVRALAAHPVLVQRPIVIFTGGRAMVARTSEQLAQLASL